MEFILRSKGMEAGHIMDKYGKRAEKEFIWQGVPQISFPLAWENPPEGTESFAVVFQDYDDIPEDGFSWIHWLVADIPKDRRELPENASRCDPTLIQGKNSWVSPLPGCRRSDEIVNFYGGAGPETGVHEYEIGIYALDTVLGLATGFYYNQLRKAMRGHILGEAYVTARYRCQVSTEEMQGQGPQKINRLKFNRTKCIGCGMCAMACSAMHQGEYAPSKARIHISAHYNQGKQLVFTESYCTLCRTCEQVCPVNAITAFEKIEVDMDACIGCGICAGKCPKGAVTMVNKKPRICDTCKGDPACVKICPHGALQFK